MAGRAQIRIMPQADLDVDQITSFLSESLSPEIAIRFVNAFYRKLDTLELMPGLGTPSTKNSVIRKAIIDRFNMIYYEWLDNGDINILRVIDRRSNPTDNPFE